ncbi:MAG: EamA family transporter [Rhodocyclaceae bacterium]|nr:MAG: EamA family transporter [Rhodocyclaceae bacterium]
MPLSALLMVVVAGFIHACWNIVAKKAGGDVRFACFTSIVLMVFWAPVGLWVGWHQVPVWGWQEWGLIGISGALHVVYYVSLLRGYRKAELTVVYPLARGFGPLLSSLGAIVLLGEQISVIGLCGIAAVVFGVLLVAGGPDLFRDADDPRQRAGLEMGVRYGLLTGVFIASYTVVDGFGVKVLLLSPILIDYFGNFVRLVFLVPPVLRRPAEALTLWKTQWKYATIVGIVSPIPYVLVLYAMQVAPLSHVAPAREVSMLFAALLGGQLLGESNRMVRFLGATSIAVGVIALSVG